MIQVQKQQNGTILSVQLSGQIEGSIDLMSLIGPPPVEMVVNTKDIVRINSEGIKSWIIYFQHCQDQKTQLKFIECSPAIMEQINSISNFTCGGTVESIYVPYFCAKCQKQILNLFTVEEIKKLALNLPEKTCDTCQGPTVFDDVVDEYFAFLQRKDPTS